MKIDQNWPPTPPERSRGMSVWKVGIPARMSRPSHDRCAWHRISQAKSLWPSIVRPGAPGLPERVARELPKDLIELGHGSARETAHGVLHPVQDVVHSGAMFLEELLALGRDVVYALALLLNRADEALVFEQLEGRVNRACRGGVAARHALFERLDDLVAV